VGVESVGAKEVGRWNAFKTYRQCGLEKGGGLRIPAGELALHANPAIKNIRRFNERDDQKLLYINYIAFGLPQAAGGGTIALF
jgi:hypothetical protein